MPSLSILVALMERKQKLVLAGSAAARKELPVIPGLVFLMDGLLPCFDIDCINDGWLWLTGCVANEH